jgi:tetratricopeptide (TPR) repeat protein
MKIEIELSIKKILVNIGLCLLLVLGGWGISHYVQYSEGRTKPQIRSHEEMKQPVSEMIALSPQEAINIARENPATVDPQRVIAAIATLDKALLSHPEDDEIILALSDLAFTARDFAKAKDVLTRYLDRHPENLETKAKIASALTMLGQTDQAIRILEEVIATDPSHFEGNAYLSIALGRKGDITEARRRMELAISNAPNQEVAERLKLFLNPDSVPTSSSNQTVSNQTGDSLTSWLRNHPVIGPKIVDIQFNNDSVTIVVQNFPIDRMPIEMRNQFLEKLKGQLPTEIKNYLFKDADSTEILFSGL